MFQPVNKGRMQVDSITEKKKCIHKTVTFIKNRVKCRVNEPEQRLGNRSWDLKVVSLIPTGHYTTILVTLGKLLN